MQTPDPRNHHDWQSFGYIHCKLSVMLEEKGGVGGGHIIGTFPHVNVTMVTYICMVGVK